MAGSTSVQLPDLLSLGRALELRTNRHCHAVTAASENWFLTQQNILTNEEKAGLRSMKIGLWASVCFSTCDPPQLRLTMDFLTALVVCNCRLVHARTPRECGWMEEQPPDSASCLSGNDSFFALMPQLLNAMPSDSSRQKFNRSAEAFRTAQMKIISHRQSGTLPTLETYAELRRDLGGIPMLFDLIEMAEGLQMPSGEHRWNTLKNSAADAIALSLDIFAYNNDQFIDNQFNIVSLFRAHRNFTVQAAINQAFSLIERSLQNFLSAEIALENPVSHATSIWTWNPLGRKGPSAAVPGEILTIDSKLYLRGLKDCIIGTLNWGYETELYFGSKGDEVRQFGWVFLKDRDEGSEQG
ncbi:isoprenoid synthase domain-containing protein [Mycena sanguinolenta]|nr:isoprenoid synthase domain-containing protein [Mycena sanguinolenta]